MLIRFWVNHHLLDIFQRPLWRVIKGRSRTYVDKVISGERKEGGAGREGTAWSDRSTGRSWTLGSLMISRGDGHPANIALLNDLIWPTDHFLSPSMYPTPLNPAPSHSLSNNDRCTFPQ